MHRPGAFLIARERRRVREPSRYAKGPTLPRCRVLGLTPYRRANSSFPPAFVHGSCTKTDVAFIQNARPNRKMQSDFTLPGATHGVA